MADVVSKKKRSEIMSRVKNKDSKIEILFRKKLWAAGIRYRKNVKNYFGKPDIVIKKNKTVIFIDSCFWHGCKKHFRLPEQNKKYWIKKIKRNKEKDREVATFYKKSKWKIIRIWEHEIEKDTDKVFKKIEWKSN